MQEATKAILAEYEALSEKRKEEIRNTPDTVQTSGTTYYVSTEGNDENSGLSPDAAWRTTQKVTDFKLNPGDCVRFRRGDLFRGGIMAQPGVTYAAYGSGPKPTFYGWDKSLADPKLWTCVDSAHHIWKLEDKILDCGTLVFNEGEEHSRKLIPSFIGGRFVCRDDESRVFDMVEEMTQDLDIFCKVDEVLSDRPSRGQNFLVPLVDTNQKGDLFLRCDRGNPGEVFESIEAIPKRVAFLVRSNHNVHVDNLCMKYFCFCVSGGGDNVTGMHISNCEMGWIGGNIQDYEGMDPNFPQGERGTVTRFGNAIEIYGGCIDYTVTNCYIYQVYDAGMSHQITTEGRKYVLKDVLYKDNLAEYCVYAIEYFLDKNKGDKESYMENIEMCGNILRFSGYGWGQQRHNVDTPALIKGWSYVNTARDYCIHDNILDRCAYRMVHLVAEDSASCPVMRNNTYIQDLGQKIGQYGGKENGEPENYVFDENAEDILINEFKEENPKVYYIKNA